MAEPSFRMSQAGEDPDAFQMTCELCGEYFWSLQDCELLPWCRHHPAECVPRLPGEFLSEFTHRRAHVRGGLPLG